MARGPFYNLKTRYTLQFPGFSVQAHLKSLNTFQAAAAGLDVTGQNLEALLADPMEGDPRILDGMSATVSPSFRGLEGTFTVKGRPESRLLPVVDALGVKLYGTFTESASSVDEGADWADWTRRRFAEGNPDAATIGPSGSYVSSTIRLKFSERPADEMDPSGFVRAEAVALAGTLLEGDLLHNPAHGTYQARGVTPEREYERARLEK